MDGYYVRRATNEDAAQCLRLIKEGYMSHVKPIYHAALTKGYNNHLKALVLGLAVAAWTVHMGGSPLMAVAYGAIAYISYLLIMFGFVYTQMVNEGNKTLEHGLKNIDTYYSAKGSYMWVVCIGEDKPAKESKDADTDKEGDEGADEAEEKTPDPIVACVALRKDPIAGEATLQHLVVHKASQRQGIATTLMKHVAKHAKAKGVDKITARCSSGQVPAINLLTSKAGYKEVLVTKVNPWFAVHKLVLDVS